MSPSRVGLGFDSHSFSDKGTLVLGGVRFKNAPALKGHSDGDCLLHALIDALLGAAGLGDIGDFFPDTSRKWKGASSRHLLRDVLHKIKKTGVQVRQIDSIIIADRPRLGPAKARLRKSMAALLGIAASRVNIKAKTPEGLSFFKAPGGIAAWVVANCD